MNSEQIQATLKSLEQATTALKILLQNPVDQAEHREIVAEVETQIQQALATLKISVDPPDISQIPTSILDQLNRLGIPSEDLNVQIALSSHHLSQILGMITEIQNKAELIKHRKDYFLDRLPQMPIEQLGPRVPIVTAADFEEDFEPIPKEIREQIKAKYKLDKLIQKKQRSRLSIFEKVKQAEQLLSQPQSPPKDEDFYEDLPF